MNKNGLKLLLLAFVIFFAIVSGGCGGGGGSLSNPDNTPNNPDNPGDNVPSQVLDDEILDSDGDGVPDILDFDDIDQQYHGENYASRDIKISSIPSRHYFKNFKDDASFTADLTAGTEYTVEISEGAKISGVTEVIGYAYPIGDNIPCVEVVNPQGKELEFLDFGTYDENYDASEVIDLKDNVIELSFYPTDNPYMICYTFTPSVTGSYKINLSRTVSDDVASADDRFEHVTTLFIYKELRDGTDRNEAGHYKRYKFKDEDGKTSDTISMTDTMELRKAYNSLVYDTLSVVLELDGSLDDLTDDDWENIAANPKIQNQFEAYFECLYRLKKYYGIFDGKDIENEKQAVIQIGGTVSADYEDDDENDEDVVAVTTVAPDSVSAAAPTKLNAGGTQIKQQLYGIPYSDAFQEGVGYFAITGVQSRSNAIRSFKLNVPKKKNVKTNYTATFVSSQEDREKLSTTNAGASLSIGGFGLGASYSSESKFKFGLTSTTYVIHYEEVERAYRTLKDKDYQLKEGASKILKSGVTKFREKYGDYFVAGYKYGGTYDAFITITTKTMEQLEEVKTKLTANFNTAKGAASADVGKATKETLNKNDATVSIQIKTAGIDVSKLSIPAETTDISKIPESLNSFREALKKTKTSGYQPVYVVLRRYSLLDEVDKQMDKQNDSGLVPIPPKHSKKILAFNSEKLIMDSYYNVIADLTDQQIDSAVRNKYKREYESIIDAIETGGNNFYAQSNSARLDSLKKKMENLGGRLKALGDRYVFYQILMSKQKQEKNYSTNDINYKPFGKDGGSIGLTSFSVSTAVTSDIAAGKDFDNKKDENAVFLGNNVWTPSYTAYTRDGSSEAVFCWIQVIARNPNDNARNVTNSPCIGKNWASFYFESGGTRRAEWETILRSMRFKRANYPFGGLE